MCDSVPSTTVLSLDTVRKTRKSERSTITRTTCSNNNKLFTSSITLHTCCNNRRREKPTYKLSLVLSSHQYQHQQQEQQQEEEPLLFKEPSAPQCSLRVKEKSDKEEKKRRRGRQVIKRWNLMAKQVIAINSALSLGFVSQLWVDTSSWVVLAVEVRPNLLSAAESERFPLEDVVQVGDVVLVESEDVIENGFQMVGLETLVGYRVVTPGRQSIGKVRGYSFNIDSGAVESLELDSFGFSFIPSSLVSTYALLVEDVLEVSSDTVVVHEAAASRIQRITKGLWDAKNVRTSVDGPEEYPDAQSSGRSNTGGRSIRKSFSKKKNDDVDWELPMDYL